MSSEDQQEKQKETVWVSLFDVEGLNSSVLDGDTVVAKVEFMPNADLEGVDKELADLIGQLNLSETKAKFTEPATVKNGKAEFLTQFYFALPSGATSSDWLLSVSIEHKQVYGSIKSIPVATNFACQEVPLKGGGKVTFLQDLFPLSEALDDQLWLTGVVKTMLKALFHWNDDARAIAFIHKFPRLVQGGFMQNWRHLSEEVLQDPTRANKEGQFLIKVANIFADEFRNCLLYNSITAQKDHLCYIDAAKRRLMRSEIKGSTPVDWYSIGVQGQLSSETRNIFETGRRLGYAESVEALNKAQQQQPNWPYPTYEIAWGYCLQNDVPKALEAYREVNRMCPRGFFTSLAAQDTLERENDGRLENGTYHNLLLIVDEGFSTFPRKEDRYRCLKSILDRNPSFPVGWLRLAENTDNVKLQLEHLKEAEKYNPDPHTKGQISLARGLLYCNELDRKEDAIDIFGDLALDPASSLASAAGARAYLGQILA